MHSANAGLMFVQRRTRCPNINPALAEYILFARIAFVHDSHTVTLQRCQGCFQQIYPQGLHKGQY